MAAAAWSQEGLMFKQGEPLAYENLTVFPLYPAQADAAPQEDFLTFEEASAQKKIEVTELDGNENSAQVNAVHVSNVGDRPIFLLAGEIILGGKQDRVVGQSTVIPPKQAKVQVQVFCVEQGRWDGRAGFQASGKMGHAKLREMAVFQNNQGLVWREVAEANQKRGAAPSTGTYRASLEQAGQDQRTQAYVDALLPSLAKDDKAIGVAVAIDGKLDAVDTFMNPKLFGRVREKLLYAYALEAASSPEAGQKKQASAQDAEGFFQEIQKAQQTQRQTKSGEATNIYFDDAELSGVKTQGEGQAPVHTFYKRKSAVKQDAPEQRYLGNEDLNEAQLNNIGPIRQQRRRAPQGPQSQGPQQQAAPVEVQQQAPLNIPDEEFPLHEEE
jgi:hypothetical protein